MFTSDSAVTANDAGPGGPSLSMDTQLFVNRLRESVQQHQVCYEVWPEWYMKDGRKIQIGFELQLCGINNHVVLNGDPVHSVPGCPIAFVHTASYETLRNGSYRGKNDHHVTKFRLSITLCIWLRRNVNDGARLS